MVNQKMKCVADHIRSVTLPFQFGTVSRDLLDTCRASKNMSRLDH